VSSSPVRVLVVGADAVTEGGRQHRGAEMAWRQGPTGVEEQGMSAMGFPRNLRGPVVSAREPARGAAG
jgi:hypothetical protein